MEESSLPDVTDWFWWGKTYICNSVQGHKLGGVWWFQLQGRSSSAVSAVPSAGVSRSKDGRDPQLHTAVVAVGAVGVFSGESCWAPPDLLICHGDAVVKGIPLGARFSYGHSQG